MYLTLFREGGGMHGNNESIDRVETQAVSQLPGIESQSFGMFCMSQLYVIL